VPHGAIIRTSDRRQQIRAHDLRASFVTVALANGRSETWVADRTGHTSSVMLNRYRRLARSFQELSVGDFIPLDRAIPELSIGPGLATQREAIRESEVESVPYSERAMGFEPTTCSMGITNVLSRPCESPRSLASS